MRPGPPATGMTADVESRLRAALALAGHDSSDFDLNPGTVLPEGRILRPAGVLVAVTVFGGAGSVLLTKRSSMLWHHPGQIAFPGGKQDPGDPTVIDAALRGSRRTLARALLNERRLAKPLTPLTRHWLERLGVPDAARA